MGDKELMVILVRTVWEVQPWDVSGGGAGYGSKERSKGRECVIFSREWDPLNRQGVAKITLS